MNDMFRENYWKKRGHLENYTQTCVAKMHRCLPTYLTPNVIVVVPPMLCNLDIRRRRHVASTHVVVVV